MKITDCEDVLMAMLADMDGEKTEISAEQRTLHLAECADCRREFEQMQKTNYLFKSQTRRKYDADLWSSIEQRIENETVSPAATVADWQIFLILGAFLVTWKLSEMLLPTDFSFWFKVIPLIFVIALFGFLKENPFKINTELVLEK